MQSACAICGLPAVPHFPTLSRKRHVFKKKILNEKCVFLFSLQIFYFLYNFFIFSTNFLFSLPIFFIFSTIFYFLYNCFIFSADFLFSLLITEFLYRFFIFFTDFFYFLYQFLSETFPIPKRIQRHLITTVHRYSLTVSVIVVRFQ